VTVTEQGRAVAKLVSEEGNAPVMDRLGAVSKAASHGMHGMEVTWARIGSVMKGHWRSLLADVA
jgi:hypothetical protein